MLVDFHAIDVQAVIVKGGDDAYIYYYPADDDDADPGLTPPVNDGGVDAADQPRRVLLRPEETRRIRTSRSTKTATATSEITHTWDVDKQVKVAGASDSTYGDNASLTLPDGGNGSFTWKVTVTHTPTQSYARDGHDHRRELGGGPVTGVDITDSIAGAVIDCGGTGSTGLTVPNASIGVHVLRHARTRRCEQHCYGDVGLGRLGDRHGQRSDRGRHRPRSASGLRRRRRPDRRVARRSTI